MHPPLVVINPLVSVPPLAVVSPLVLVSSVILVPQNVVVSPLVYIFVVVAVYLNVIPPDTLLHLSRISSLTTLPANHLAWHTRTCTHSETRLC